jgi:hypothetical protein
MFSGVARHACVLVTAAGVLSGVATLADGTAAADTQDDKFLALLFDQDIPPIDNATSLIATAHKACAKLDGGMSVAELVDLIRNNGYNADWRSRLDPPDRVTRTINRFITAAVQAYCPYDAGKIVSIAAYNGRGVVTDDPDRRNRSHVVVLASLTQTMPAGEIPPTKPLPVPAQPPPPPPEELAPAPQQPPPPPPRHVQQAPQRQQQVEPPPQEAPPQEPPPQAEPPQAPAPAPEPGGGNGGAPAPESPSPAPPAPPGHIRLAP